MKKRSILALFLTLALLVTPLMGLATEDDFGKKDPASYVGSITVWSHTGAQPAFMIAEYNKLYPNVTINFEIIPSNEHEQKVNTAVASGVDVPDIFTTKTDFIKAVVASGKHYDDLLSAPYNATHLAANIEDYIVAVGTDENGALRGLSWQCPVGAIYYRRSMANEFFGTDDPEEIGKLFPTMDSIVDVARDLKEKTNGAVKLIGDYRDLRPLHTSNLDQAFVVDNVINIDPILVKYIETAKVLYEEDLDAKTDVNNANYPGLMANGEIFCMFGASWSMNWGLMNNYPEMEGDWALAAPPAPYVQGGTWMGIYPGSENKEIAYTFLNFVFSNEEFIYKYAVELGDYVSHKGVQQRIASMSPEETADLPLFKFVGNQNVYTFFNNELAKGVRDELFTMYDFTITNAGLLNNIIDMYITDQISLEDALEQYCDDLVDAYPDLERPEGY